MIEAGGLNPSESTMEDRVFYKNLVRGKVQLSDKKKL